MRYLFSSLVCVCISWYIWPCCVVFITLWQLRLLPYKNAWGHVSLCISSLFSNHVLHCFQDSNISLVYMISMNMTHTHTQFVFLSATSWCWANSIKALKRICTYCDIIAIMSHDFLFIYKSILVNISCFRGVWFRKTPDVWSTSE